MRLLPRSHIAHNTGKYVYGLKDCDRHSAFQKPEASLILVAYRVGETLPEVAISPCISH
jgi:hypothetical protein